MPTDYAFMPNKTARPIIKSWIQVTSIGIDVYESFDKLFIWATNIEKGGLIKNAKVKVYKQDNVSPSRIISAKLKNGLAKAIPIEGYKNQPLCFSCRV